MDSSPVFTSEYLQSRFNERKAESARAHRHAPHPMDPALPSRAARDDAIFDHDTSPPRRKPTTRLYQSSPANPISRSQSRKASNLSSSLNHAPRAMGAREMEDHVDKLSKQNFDLKLEVYHRREKIDELEKKLASLPRLQEDNDELIEVNEELVQELDRRDQAIEEAVVMILDLEEKVRDLHHDLETERSLNHSRRSRRSYSTGNETPKLQDPPRRKRRSGSTNPIHDTAPDRSRVSPSSARSEVDTPRQQQRHPRARQVPSFIDNDSSATQALRSMYLDGDKLIRPIPSTYSMISSHDPNDDEALSDGPPRSPVLSTLSESELKSIYGSDEKADATESAQYEASAEEDTSGSRSVASQHSEKSRLARTNRWVADRAISPSSQRDSGRKVSAETSSFQSLGDVLHNRANGPPPANLRKTSTTALNTSGKSYTPPLPPNNFVHQNTYPPTPDTMQTRPSNQSSTSIQDRGFENGQKSSRGLPQITSQHASDDAVTYRSSQNLPSQTSLLPREVDAFLDSESDNEHANSARRKDVFGAPLSHSYGSRSSLSSRQDVSSPQRRARSSTHNDLERTQSGESRPPSSSRPWSARGQYPENEQSTTPIRPSDQLARMNSDPETIRDPSKRRSIGATPTPKAYTDENATSQQQIEAPSHLATPRRNRTFHSSHHAEAVILSPSSYRAPHPLPATPPVPPPTQAKEAGSTGRIPRHTASLRARVSRLARRNSGANGINGVDTGTQSDSNSVLQSQGQSHSRSQSLSRRTKQLFHRRGSSSASKPASPTKTQRPDAFEDEDDSGRAGLFLQAANWAAPKLTYESGVNKSKSEGEQSSKTNGPKRSTLVNTPGIMTSIPLVPSPNQGSGRGKDMLSPSQVSPTQSHSHSPLQGYPPSTTDSRAKSYAHSRARSNLSNTSRAGAESASASGGSFASVRNGDAGSSELRPTTASSNSSKATSPMVGSASTRPGSRGRRGM